MRLFLEYLRKEAAECAEKGVRISVIGRRDRLSGALREAIEAAEAIDRRRDANLHLRLAVDYSSRDSILQAADAWKGHAAPTREDFARLLAGAVPDVDLLIRTGGEQRLSDFLLWESRLRRAALHAPHVARFREARPRTRCAISSANGASARPGGPRGLGGQNAVPMLAFARLSVSSPPWQNSVREAARVLGHSRRLRGARAPHGPGSRYVHRGRRPDELGARPGRLRRSAAAAAGPRAGAAGQSRIGAADRGVLRASSGSRNSTAAASRRMAFTSPDWATRAPRRSILRASTARRRWRSAWNRSPRWRR